MFNIKNAKEAMEKLIAETDAGLIKWYTWGKTDPDDDASYFDPNTGNVDATNDSF